MTLRARFLFLVAAVLLVMACVTSTNAKTITVQSATIPNWQRARAPILYVFSDKTYTAVDYPTDGTNAVIFSGSPNSLNAFKKVTCTLLTGTVTIPSFTIPSTIDGIDTSDAHLSFYLYDGTTKIGPFGEYVSFVIPSFITSASGCSPVGTCVTFSDLKIYNNGSPLLPLPSYYTKNETDQKIAALAGGSNFAPKDATFITQTANAVLTNEQALSLLGTGLVKNTTGTGVLSIAISGTDYQPAGNYFVDPGSGGLLSRTSLNTVTPRSIAVGSNLSVSNADGTAGNPTVSLGANVVAAVVNDTNINGSIAANSLTLAWAGTLAKGRQNAATVYNDQANTYGAFLQDLGLATLKIPTGAGLAPTANGNVAYDSTANKYKFGQSGVTFIPANEGRQIINGTGITGGGDFSADRTLSVVADSVTERLDVQNNAALVGTRKAINFIAGSNITYTIADNPGSNRVDVTINGTIGSTTWSNIGNPGGNQALTMAAFTSTWTWNAATGGGVNLFNLIDTNSNSGTGYLLNVDTATGSSLKPFRVGATGTDQITVSAAGVTTIRSLTLTNPLTIGNGGTGQITAGAAFAALAPSSPAKGTLIVYDGSNWVNIGVGANAQVLTADSAQATGVKWFGSTTGITTLNTLVGATQTFATGTTGADFNIVSSGTVHTFNIPDASAANRGLVTIGTQTMAGAKTWTGNAAFSGTATFTNIISHSINGQDPLNPPFQVGPSQVEMGLAGTYADSGTGNIFQLHSYATNSGSRPVVGGQFLANVTGATSQGWGIVTGCYGNANGSTCHSQETDFGSLVSGAVTYGNVVVYIGNQNSAGNYIQMHSAGTASAGNGILLALVGGHQPLTTAASIFSTTGAIGPLTSGIDFSSVTSFSSDFLIGPNQAGLTMRRTGGTNHQIFYFDSNNDVILNRGSLIGSGDSNVVVGVGTSKTFQVRNHSNASLVQVDEFTGRVSVGTTVADSLLHLKGGPAWSSSSFGAALVVDGTLNNSLGIFDSGSTNPWAITNVAGAIWLSTMPALGDVATPPNTKVIFAADGSVQIAAPQLTVGSGTGLTVNQPGSVQREVHRVTVTFAALACAALTCDKTIATLPAKTRLAGIIADTTIVYTGGGTTAATIIVGKTAGGNEYVVSHDVRTAVITKGLADADLGASMTRATAVQGGDLTTAMWTGTTAVSVRLTTVTANTNALTQGSTTYYLITEKMP